MWPPVDDDDGADPIYNEFGTQAGSAAQVSASAYIITYTKFFEKRSEFLLSLLGATYICSAFALIFLANTQNQIHRRWMPKLV